MDINFKNKILYSNIITDLILTNKVIGIYLGGSRVLSLESSESDYDIIVITKDKSLQCYHGYKIDIPGYKCHIQIGNIQDVLYSIKHFNKITTFNGNKLLQDLFLMSEDNIIYSTNDLLYLREFCFKYTKELYTLALENTVNNLTNKLYYPITTYRKKHYHLLVQYYLLKNFLTASTIGLTEKQKEILKVFKITKVLPPAFFDALKGLQPAKYLTSKYNYFNLYKEVKHYE